MWTPRYIVYKADGVPGRPIPKDEPCFVIRGQDWLAVDMLDHYIVSYLNSSEWDGTSDSIVLHELVEHRSRLIEWRMMHPDLIKAADR